MLEFLRFINPPTMEKPPGYSHIVEVKGGARVVYFAGQLGVDTSGKFAGAPGDFKAQTVQAFENLKAALEAVGAGFGHLVKINNYLVDIERNMLAFREVRDRYLVQPDDTLRFPTAHAGYNVMIGPNFQIGSGGSGPCVPTLTCPRCTGQPGSLPVLNRLYGEGLHHGELRLWNPYLFCGYPLYNNLLVHPFYPPNLILHAILPSRIAYDLNLMLHFFFSGAVMFWPW
jgi:enamine deaminase RidA (YjgF/YER057c/UK114 family)